ncbi:MAG: hypothetical protein U0521_22685 [Anaerolineae bacterium]
MIRNRRKRQLDKLAALSLSDGEVTSATDFADHRLHRQIVKDDVLPLEPGGRSSWTAKS